MFGILVSKKLFCSCKRYKKKDKQESKNDLIPQLLQYTHTLTQIKDLI